MNPTALRSAIFEALNVPALTGLLTDQYSLPAVFSEQAEQVDDSGAGKFFPYVTFSQTADPGFNTKDQSGMSATIQVDAWSRLNTSEAEVVAKAVYDLLHRQPLNLAGHITTECESMDFTRDPDGITRRGMATFEVVAL